MGFNFMYKMMRQIGVFRDPRDFQNAFLGLFLFLGVWGRDWQIKPIMVAAALASCLLTQWIGDRLAHTAHPSLRSALITGLSLCLLLRANSFLTVVLAGVLSISGKFLLRYHGKHFFNPSNMGIVAVILLTGDAWITPGQWGNDLWYVLVFFAAGGLITRKVGRWDTTGVFLGLYGLMEAMRNAWLGWTWDVYAHKMMSGSLLLFAFFMITDPRSIPDDRRARLLWTALVAGLTYILRNKYFLPTAPFWALFALSPFTVIFDLIRPASRFQWRPLKLPQPQEVTT